MSDKSLIEAALFVSGKGASLKEIEKATGVEEKTIKDLIDQLTQEYAQRDTGLIISTSEKGYLIRVKPEFEEKVLSLVPEADLPKSMLKTLALIAYEQPITQNTVVKLRGNRVYHYLGRLIEQGYLDAKPSGRTKMLTTTAKFNQYFKIQDIKDKISAKTTELPREPKQTILEMPEEASVQEEKKEETG
jgi:segregation and condensation protein B